MISVKNFKKSSKQTFMEGRQSIGLHRTGPTNSFIHFIILNSNRFGNNGTELIDLLLDNQVHQYHKLIDMTCEIMFHCDSLYLHNNFNLSVIDKVHISMTKEKPHFFFLEL